MQTAHCRFIFVSFLPTSFLIYCSVLVYQMQFIESALKSVVALYESVKWV